MGFFSRAYNSQGIRGRILLSGISVIAFVLIAVMAVTIVRSDAWFEKAAQDRMRTATEMAMLDLNSKSETKLKLIDLLASDEDLVFNASVLYGVFAESEEIEFDEGSQELNQGIANKLRNAAHVGDFDALGFFGHQRKLMAFYDRRSQITGFFIGGDLFSSLDNSQALSFEQLPFNVQEMARVLTGRHENTYERFRVSVAQTIQVPVREQLGNDLQSIGSIVGATLITDEYASQLSKITDTDVHFYHGTERVAGMFADLDPTPRTSMTAAIEGTKTSGQAADIEWSKAVIDNQPFTQAVSPIYQLDGETGALVILHSDLSDNRSKAYTMWLMVITAIVAGSLGSVLLVLAANQIVRPLKQSVELSNLMATGDLTVQLSDEMDESADEAALLRRAMLAGVKQLRHTLQGVASATKDVDQMATELLGAVSEEMGIATEQASSVTEITATMEELSATSKQIAENSNQVLEIASTNLTETESGSEIVQNLMEKMDEINANNDESIKKIMELGRNSQEITKVIDLISGIADQTKLIAFNASIEASGAGDAGRRFGVVAMEIKRLANNVMDSTGEIKARVREIQTAVNQLVMASEKGSSGIRGGRELAVATVSTLTSLVSDARSTSDAARQISMSTQQQKTANDQVVVSLREIAQAANNTTESINRTKSIAHGLSELSQQLKKQVDRFKLE